MRSAASRVRSLARGERAAMLTGVLAIVIAGTNLISASRAEAAPGIDDKWRPDFAASQVGTVYASAEFQGRRIAAGGLTTAGLQPFKLIAGWDGSSWSSLGLGITGTDVRCLTSYNNQLVAGGNFTNAGGLPTGNIASWDGTSWHQVGSGAGMNGPVLALTVFGTDLIAAGAFASVDGVPVNGIARWNGSNWAPLGAGLRRQFLASGYVTSLAIYKGALYAGGVIDTAGSVAARNIARWNGTSWDSVGAGVDAQVNALTAHNGILVAGGSFLNAGNNPASYIAEWTGSAWVAMGPGFNGPANALISSGSHLYVGGDFYQTGAGAPLPFVADWSGSAWSTVGSGCNGRVVSLLQAPDGLYAWGDFSKAGGLSTLFCARFGGADWVPLGEGLGDDVNALASYQGRIAATGTFLIAGGKSVFGVALWDSTGWSPLGSGLSPTGAPGNALAVYDSALVVGGAFAAAGGISNMNNIAAWKAGAWHQLGAGFSGATVNALTVYQGKLVATGSFGLSVWNGTTWASLGATVTGVGYALAVQGTDLIVGGSTLSVGGTAMARIIRWNGTTWSPVVSTSSPGIPASTVYALGVWRDTLYAGGSFTGHVARWTGTAWATVGGGTNTTSQVRSISAYFDKLIIAGNFSTVGGSSIARIAQWDGTSWGGLGSGISDFGFATLVAPHGYGGSPQQSLFVGGHFRTAGLHSSSFIARWDDYPLVDVSERTDVTLPKLAIVNARPNPSRGETRLSFSLARSGEWRIAIYDSQGREVRRATSSSPSGPQEYRWDGRDTNGNLVAAGIYFARLQSGGTLSAGRIVRLR